MTKLLISLLLLSSFSAIGQEFPNLQSDLQKGQIKGPVKSIYSVSYATVKSSKNPEPIVIKEIDSTVYDRNGNIIKYFMFDQSSSDSCTDSLDYSGSLITKRISKCSWENSQEIELYTYDASQNLTGIYSKFENDTIANWTYEYNEKNQLIVSNSRFDTYSFEYNSEGELLKKTRIGSNPEIHEISTYTKSNDSVMSVKRYTGKMEYTGSSRTIYNKEHQIIKVCSYDSNEHPYTERSWKYDAYGNVVEDMTISHFTRDTLSVIYEYTYDDYGNWLSKKMIVNNKEDTFPTTRTLTYYDL